MRVNGSTFSDDESKARIFGDYFQSAYSPPAASPSAYVSAASAPPGGATDDISFSVEAVYDKLEGTKRKLSRTPDDLPPIVFRELADGVAVSLSLIFCKCFETSTLPRIFRHSIFTPVFKKGDRHAVDNYRQVGQCSIPCLIMEGIVADSLQAHLRSRGLLDPHQHGFTRKRSTAGQLLEVAHFWASSKNLHRPVHCVYECDEPRPSEDVLLNRRARNEEIMRTRVRDGLARPQELTAIQQFEIYVR